MSGSAARALLLATLGLVACAPATPPMDAAQFATVRAALAESPTIQRQAVADCVTNQSARSAADRTTLAALLRVEVADAPRVLCQRIMQAIADGRLDHADYVALSSGEDDPATLMRLLQAVQEG